MGRGRTKPVANLPVNLTLPVISGTMAQGQVLTTTTGTWTNSPSSFRYRWRRNTVAISGAVAQSYTLVQADVGTVITVSVTAVSSTGTTTATVTSASTGTLVTGTAAAPLNLTLPVISGTTQDGLMLSCTHGSWSNNPTSYAYQWRRGTSNVGTNSSTYTCVTADVGSTLTCTVSAINSTGTTTVSSAPTAVVAAAPVAPSAPVNTTLPVISGTPQDTSVLTVTQGTWSNSPTSYSYQWRKGSTNIGTNQSTYTCVTADVGSTITCSVTAINAIGSTSSTSVATATVIAYIVATTFLDPAITVPVASLAVAANIYPPAFDASLGVDIKAGIHSLRMVAANNYAFTSPSIDKLIALTDTIAAAATTITSELSVITNGINYFRFRIETTNTYSSWSPVVAHGDTVAPTIISTLTPSALERAPLLITITASELSYFALTGADAAILEKVGTEPATSIQLRLAGNAQLDWDIKTSYSFNIQPTDLAGNIGTKYAHTITVTEIVDDPSSFIFNGVTSASLSTSYTSNTITIAGMAAGVIDPVSIIGGTYSKNGGAFTNQAGTATNGDTFSVRITTGAAYAAAALATLSVGGTSAGFNVITLDDPARVGVFAPSAQPAMQNIAYASNIVTYPNVDFGSSGTGVVCAWASQSDRPATSVVVGGVSATKVYQDSVNKHSLWQFPVGSSGLKNVVVTYGLAVGGCVINTATLSNAIATPTVSSTAGGYRYTPITLPAPVIPVNGVNVVFFLTSSTTLCTVSGAVLRGNAVSTQINSQSIVATTTAADPIIIQGGSTNNEYTAGLVAAFSHS